MLKLGDPGSSAEVIPKNILEQLIDMGLVHKHADGHLDFTDLGESVYGDSVEC